MATPQIAQSRTGSMIGELKAIATASHSAAAIPYSEWQDLTLSQILARVGWEHHSYSDADKHLLIGRGATANLNRRVVNNRLLSYGETLDALIDAGLIEASPRAVAS